jgi:chemotaxis signal transduction protein
MPVAHVTEITEFGTVAAVPGSGPETLGLRTLRGQVLPVADLASLLGIDRSAAPARLLIAEAGEHRACVAVDEVICIGDLPPPAEQTESSLLSGAVLAGQDLIGVIDVPRVLDTLAGASR